MALQQKLRSTSYTPQEVRFITLDTHNTRQTDAALPTAETSSPRQPRLVQPASPLNRCPAPSLVAIVPQLNLWPLPITFVIDQRSLLPPCRPRTLDSSWRTTYGAPPGSKRTCESPPWATPACPPVRSCSRVRASQCTAALWIQGRTGRASRFIIVMRVGSRVTGCIGWLATNGRSAVIDPLRALIMAGMYTLTLPSLGFAGRLLIAHFVCSCSDFRGYSAESLGDH